MPPGAVDHPKVRDVLPRMMAAIDNGLRADRMVPTYWPVKEVYSLGEQYHKLLVDVFQRDFPQHVDRASDHGRNLEIAWLKTKDWRHAYIDQAVSRTRLGGGMGLQRQQLYYLLGEEVDLDPAYITTNALIAAAARRDPETGLAMEQFLKWLAQCHYLNQARALKVAANFPVYDTREDFLLDALLEPRPRGVASNSIRCEVDLPPIDALARSSPRDIVAMRRDPRNRLL